MRHQNKAFAKFVAIPVFALIGLGAIVGGGSGSSSQPEEPEAKNAAEAAQVNDVVKIIYPSSTIMCAERNDASKVYIVGETMLRQTMRIENSVWKAIDAERDGQKRAMASAYSCEWAPKKEARFVVQQKDIIGDKNSLFYTADYCLRPETSSDGKCFWIIATADMNPRIKRVGHAFTQQDADRLKDAGRKLQPDNGKL